ncbi:MAG: putative ABC transporter permease protein [Candidatus Celerinatantimonas neptuna]|nr:MAG: putative ABC transporter permease protein [Candidatus Celerinatantimonas neptuna]
MIFPGSQFKLTLLIIGTLLIAIISLGIGPYNLPISHVIKVLIEPVFGHQQGISPIEHQVIWDVRLPRVIMAFLAGSGLALCGATLQGVFRNSLVGPHIIGVSAGAAFGGTLAILLSWSPAFLLMSTFTSGMVALLMVFLIASWLGNKNRLILILAGVILSGFFGALVSLMQYLADTEETLPNIVFWLLGSFSTAHWTTVVMLAIPFAIATTLLMCLRWRINILSMGEQESQTLDHRASWLRWLILTLCAMIVSAQVAVSGSIGWVGLIVPHMARLWIGPDHRRLLPAAMWLGGGFMIIVDDLARSITTAEVPLGIITALLGAPLLVLLLYLHRRKGIL